MGNNHVSCLYVPLYFAPSCTLQAARYHRTTPHVNAGVKFDPLENRNPWILLSNNLAQLIRSVGRTHVPNLAILFSEVSYGQMGGIY